MKTTSLSAILLSALLALTGCATTESRIHKQQAEFDTWPAEVQQKVKAGEVGIGFSPAMVLVALGEPDRTFTRTTAQGSAQVWSYDDRGPKFSIGLGMGTSRGSSAYGAGVTTGNDTFERDEVMRIIFEGGKVSAIEKKK